jgi:hypothetical protein
LHDEVVIDIYKIPYDIFEYAIKNGANPLKIYFDCDKHKFVISANTTNITDSDMTLVDLLLDLDYPNKLVYIEPYIKILLEHFEEIWDYEVSPYIADEFEKLKNKIDKPNKI